MIKVKVVCFSSEYVDKDAWWLLENEAQHLSIFQTFSWAEVLKSTGMEPRFLMLMNRGDPLLGFLMFKSRFFPGIFCAYEARKGPLVRPKINANVLFFLVSALKDFMKKESPLYFFWEPPFSPYLEQYVLNRGFSLIPSSTFVIDLSLSLESLWNSLEKRAKWGVKKAKKMGVTVSEVRDWKDWKSYYDMYVYENLQKCVRPRSLDLHRSIYHYLLPDDRVKLFIAKHQGRMIAGGLFLTTPHEMLFYESASDARFLNLQPNSVIQWHAIEWAKNHGIRHYDLGGALWKPDRNHFLYGVHMFKRQWGGKLHRYNSFALNKFYIIGRNAVLKSSKIGRLYYALESLQAVKRFDRV